jgi:hypothetical protein
MNLLAIITKGLGRRRFSVFLALVALVVQLVVPVVHERENLVFEGVHHSGGSAPELHVADWHVDPGSHHDASGCSQCRIVSQARTLSASLIETAVPLLCSDRIDAASFERLAHQRGLDTAPVRGPPLSA